MTAPVVTVAFELRCDHCGYDLRAQPPDGKCPECGLPVSESRRLVAIPRRPAWRDSDPRWRRRMLAGVWVLVLLPLVEVVLASDSAAKAAVPNVFHFPGTLRLGETLVSILGVHQPLLFCIGLVLLFGSERTRRSSRFDWVHRWGVLCNYATLLLTATPVLFISALVMVGIGALLQSMPLKYQPGITPWFVNVSCFYLRYGPQPNKFAGAVLTAFSSTAMMLVCVPLYDALRSSGSRRLAALVVGLLGLSAVANVALVALSFVGIATFSWADVGRYGWYSRPDLRAYGITDLPLVLNLNVIGSLFLPTWAEFAKWCTILTIAVWLSIAQITARWRDRRANASYNQRLL